MMRLKKIKVLSLMLTAAVFFTLTGCGEKDSTTASPKSKTIRIGTLSTIEPFISILKDKLVEKGYDVEVVMFDANNMPATATRDGDIDGFIHNHLPWIQTFNKESNANLQMVKPYLGYYRSALYSVKHKTVEEIPENAVIAIPGDPSNIEKSLLFLQKIGLLTLGQKKESFYTILDIKKNHKKIKLLETEISTTARSINDADAVIAGAIRIKAAGIDPNSFIAEDMSTQSLPVGLTVAPDSINKEWVKDAMKILSSSGMKKKFNEIFGGTIVLYKK